MKFEENQMDKYIELNGHRVQIEADVLKAFEELVYKDTAAVLAQIKKEVERAGGVYRAIRLGRKGLNDQ